MRLKGDHEMATAKKPVKKTTTKRKTPAKRKSAPKKTNVKSFRVSPDTRPFMSFQVTKQTVYWAILLGFILILFLWILNIQLDILRITESINNL